MRMYDVVQKSVEDLAMAVQQEVSTMESRNTPKRITPHVILRAILEPLLGSDGGWASADRISFLYTT